MSEERTSFWRRHRWLMGIGGGVLVVLVALVVAGILLARRVEPYLRAQIVQALTDRLHARVELDSFHVALASGRQGRWGLVAEGRGLRIWPTQSLIDARAQQLAAHAIPAPNIPMIQLDEFHFRAPLEYKSGGPLVISLIHLSGLSIHVPPKSARPQAAVAGSAGGQPKTDSSAMLSRTVVENMQCDHALLVIETDKPDKLPMGFPIENLHLTHVTANAPVEFEAQLINPKPVGAIHTKGKFGPWQVDDPGESPVEGVYQFDHADLSPFKGIAGILNSTGNFQGTLRHLAVEGDADVKDFSLDRFSSPLPLHTHFQARVDGTNGDTWLEPVQATLGRAHFTTSGRIVRMKTVLENGGVSPQSPEADVVSPFVGGHDILLDIDIQHQRIDDFMRLTSDNQKPLLTGVVTVKAKLHIPPGKEKVLHRMILDGAFQLVQAQFTSDKIQTKVDELSLRGQGKPGEAKKPQPDDVNSEMRSHFRLASAVVALPDLEYAVPGANIQLKGTYGLDGGALNFEGNARMDATVSQMVGGWKGFLLKPADRIFKKDGVGALIPIHVNGTREAPKFGVDFGRIKGGGTHPQRPDQQPDQQSQPPS